MAVPLGSKVGSTLRVVLELSGDECKVYNVVVPPGAVPGETVLSLSDDAAEDPPQPLAKTCGGSNGDGAGAGRDLEGAEPGAGVGAGAGAGAGAAKPNAN